MRFKWECSDCESQNQTDLSYWSAVKDGQGFQTFCDNCGAEVEVDIEVNVRTI